MDIWRLSGATTNDAAHSEPGAGHNPYALPMCCIRSAIYPSIIKVHESRCLNGHLPRHCRSHLQPFQNYHRARLQSSCPKAGRPYLAWICSPQQSACCPNQDDPVRAAYPVAPAAQVLPALGAGLLRGGALGWNGADACVGCLRHGKHHLAGGSSASRSSAGSYHAYPPCLWQPVPGPSARLPGAACRQPV